MHYRKITVTTLSLLLLICMNASTSTAQAAVTSIQSRWLTNPVTPDGEITNTAEWSDAQKTEITLGLNGGKSPPHLRTWLWVKNDETKLYLMLKIEYFKSLQYDAEDQTFIYYLWADEGTENWDESDAGWVYQLGSPTDLHGYNGVTWTMDTIAGGQNNVKGGGYYDSFFYWFEIVKTLNSGDGYDWKLNPGDTFGAGNPTQTKDLLYVGLYDDSQSKRYENRVAITLSTEPETRTTPVGGDLEPNAVNYRNLVALAGILALSIITLTRHSGSYH
jgi:hypothetical protein